MTKRKLRGYVLPTLYVIILMLIFGTVSVVSTFINSKQDYLYSVPVIQNISTSVVSTEDDDAVGGIIKPYVGENVNIGKYFYDVNSDEEKQANSLIYFENTYMKNTGLLYVSNEEFDCVSVLDGTVLNIKEDDILGNVVEIEHNTNLRTVYYSINDVDFKVGDFLSQGEIIGVSGANNISEYNHNLLFEVYYNGTLINPEEFYSMDVSSLY